MARSADRTVRKAFQPRARLLQLLGDQLIGSARLAIFELVKNAYDADADLVTITFEGLTGKAPRIVVVDNGTGMSLETIRDVWLVPGDDHRERQREAEARSAKYGRLPMGEKGVGRFAVHKLGNRIRLVTRASRKKECVVDIDWAVLLKSKYLSEAEITVIERDPEVFTASRTGTRIEISGLRDEGWDRREIRELYRQVTSIASPFGDRMDNFEVRLEVPDHPWWISTLPDVDQILNFAPFTFEFTFDGDSFAYEYSFKGVPGIRVAPRTVSRSEKTLQIPPERAAEDLDPGEEPKGRRGAKVTADRTTLRGIGPVKGRFYVFDRDRAVLSRFGETRFVERYLDQNGGVRVYRDGIRVYNYGEPGDDWLGLDLRRVNAPTRNLSRNIVVGVLDLDLKRSSLLREKTNREGFVENPPYDRFKRVVLGALSTLETERSIDRQKLRAATGRPADAPQGVEGPLAELRRLARKNNVAEALEPAIRKIESDYSSLRDSFLRSGLSQVGLAVVFHEVERGLAGLTRAIDAGTTIEQLRGLAGQLQRVLETSTQLLRKSEKKAQSLRDLVITSRDLSLLRFRLHRIRLTCPTLEKGSADASPVFASGLVLGALTNLIDNAVHWLKVRWPESEDDEEVRRLYINVVPDYEGGPAIIVADNGTGFLDPPDEATRPFFSRRPDGMGLGLYYANMVMQLNEGRLAFPTAEEADVPPEFDGAIVALVFGKG